MMTELRKDARIVGFLFILAAVSSIIGLLLYAPILGHSDYVIRGEVQQPQIATAAFMEVILAVSMIGISIWMCSRSGCRDCCWGWLGREVGLPQRPRALLFRASRV